MEANNMNERRVFELRPVEASLLRPVDLNAKTIAVNDRPVVAIVESTVPAALPAQPQVTTSTPLFSPVETSEFRTRWDSIQAEFVDAPRSAVQDADRLIAEAMKRLADFFTAERAALEAESLSTEDLRLAMRRYRSFFESILASGR
jgi:hypothetical protein